MRLGPFIPDSSAATIVREMAEGEDTHTTEQEKVPGKRPSWWKRLWGWTGFGEKKLWDWLQLLGTLAIPVVVALATARKDAQRADVRRLAQGQEGPREGRSERITAVPVSIDPCASL